MTKVRQRTFHATQVRLQTLHVAKVRLRTFHVAKVRVRTFHVTAVGNTAQRLDQTVGLDGLRGCREIVLDSRETAHCRSEIALVSLETAYDSRENAFSNGDKHGGWHMPKQLVPCKMQGT